MKYPFVDLPRLNKAHLRRCFYPSLQNINYWKNNVLCAKSLENDRHPLHLRKLMASD